MSSARSEFWRGVKAELPILVGVIPFGLIYGVSAINAGISPVATFAMSLIVLAGSAQFVITQLVAVGAPVIVTIITACIVNLRHILYSASVASYVKNIHPIWRWILPYVLTDEMYAVSIIHYQEDSSNQYKHWYALGAGVALATAWDISTLGGIFLGTRIPTNWSLDFTIPLTFIALIIPTLKDVASIVAALVASVVAITTNGLPYRLNLIVATFTGIVVALLLQKFVLSKYGKESQQV